MSNEIIVVTEEFAITTLRKPNALDELLGRIKTEANNFVGDTSTDKGRKQIISKAAGYGKMKVSIDNAGKSLNEERKKLTDAVNADRKKAREFLAGLQVTVRKPVTDWEKEQEELEQKRRDQAEFDIALDEGHAENELWKREQVIKKKEAEEKAKEDVRIAKEKVEAEEKFQREYEERIQREVKERADREVIEKEKKVKDDAANARKQILSEIDVVLSFEDCRSMEEVVWVELFEKKNKEYQSIQNALSLKKMATEKQEAIDQAKIDAEKALAEEVRLKKIEDEKAQAIADKKASHHAHIKKFNREALEDGMENGFTMDDMMKFITLAARNKIRHITINY